MTHHTEATMLERLAGVSRQIKALARRSRQTMFDEDDLLQEVSRIALESRIDWVTVKNSWFIVTAMNILKSAARRVRCWRRYTEQCEASASTGFADDVELTELRKRVQSRLKLLPIVERIAVEKRFFSGRRPHPGLGSTPRTRLRRAKLRLRADDRLRSLHSDLR
ncbi:MAG TPA: hypothetical protein VGG64_24180 [Pirellulales bacterium]|jgi:DNA-directed RNA polymerase specialized sigma24 family protein